MNKEPKSVEQQVCHEEVFEPLPECPFYIREGNKHVVCEGALRNSICDTRFRYKKDFYHHRKDFCYSLDWEKCPIAKLLNAKYGC